MTAEIIAKALGGRKTGRCWMARCPAHDDREPSLSIATGKDGKALLRCHAGCDQAQVIDALWVRGLWEPRDWHADRRRAYKLRRSADMAPERDDATRTEAARRIGQASAPAPGTLIETYLQSRGLCRPDATRRVFQASMETQGRWQRLMHHFPNPNDGDLFW